MPITPNAEATLAITKLMVTTLGFLHEIIELESEHPKEVMVLMMAFVSGLTLQLKDKLETLEPKLGEQLLEAISLSLEPTGRKVIEKLNKNASSLNESSSKIASDNLPEAVTFLAKRLANDIGLHLKELPFLLRNDVTVLHSLSVIVAKTLNKFAARDLDSAIADFAENVRIFATMDEEDTKEIIYN
jgi:hypothetical protein